jgi:transposase
MNELQRRVVAGAMAEMLSRGGKTAVATASGMSRNTVIKAEGEVNAGIEPSDRLRAPGGGDKSLIDTQPGLLEALDELVNPETRGNPMSKLRWTSKSSTKLADDLVGQGFEVSGRSVLRLLHRLGYSLQANAKVNEGRQHLGCAVDRHVYNSSKPAGQSRAPRARIRAGSARFCKLSAAGPPRSPDQAASAQPDRGSEQLQKLISIKPWTIRSPA